MMFKVAILLAVVAFAHGGVIAPLVHPVHPVITHAHTAVVHPAPVVHAVHAPVVHAPLVHAPLVHAPLVRTVPIVKHSPLISVHH